MHSLKSVRDEILEEINRCENRGDDILHPDYITQSVMLSHQIIEGEDADFHLCCSRLFIRNEVRQVLNKNILNASTDDQLVMEGFDYLQKRYQVKRDGEMVNVRVDKMTSEERRKKANEYFSMGDALHKHAHELIRYDDLVSKSVA